MWNSHDIFHIVVGVGTPCSHCRSVIVVTKYGIHVICTWCFYFNCHLTLCPPKGGRNFSVEKSRKKLKLIRSYSMTPTTVTLRVDYSCYKLDFFDYLFKSSLNELFSKDRSSTKINEKAKASNVQYRYGNSMCAIYWN